MTLPQSQFHQVRFTGGLDTETPPWDVKPGTLRDALNWELGVNGGYETIAGYERFDGRAKPSDADYARLDCEITGSFSVADTVTGGTSGATGYVLAIVTGGQAYLVITAITGTFNTSETLLVSAIEEGNTDNTQVVDGAPTSLLHATYRNLAADYYRGLIGVVPGSGDILGVKRLDADVFAFRNNAGGTAAVMHKASTSGWTTVALGFELAFTSGGLEYATGTVELTGGASGSVDGITVNSVEIMSGAVTFDTSLAITATAVAANISGNTSVPNYTATAAGAIVTITAATGGTGTNTFVVVSSVTTITTTDANMAGGVANTPIADGDTVTGATSTETAVVTRVVLQSGSWEAGDAAGRLIYASQSGAFQAENLNVGAGLNMCTIAGDGAAITLQPSGAYVMVNGTFGGNKRIYGADGANRGFEFDGTVYVPLATGMVDDTPDHVAIHQNHVFFAFGSSVQHSGTSTPYIWSPITGAAELATNDIVTGFQSEPGQDGTATLGIYNRNHTHMLYGTSVLDWDLNTYREELGALAFTIQQFTATTFLDDRGITDLRTAQEYGNFTYASISRKILRWLNLRKVLASASCVARDKNQYRLFFSNGEGLYVTRAAEAIVGIMPVGFPNPVLTMTSEENTSGVEEIFFGSDNGYVYQLDKGTSFDGDAIGTLLQPHFDFIGSIGWLKAFQSVRLDVTGFGYTVLRFAYELANTSADTPQPDLGSQGLDFTEIRWDSGDWDVGNWDTSSIQPVREKLFGSGENISLIMRTSSDMWKPLRIAGAYIRYLKRRPLR